MNSCFATEKGEKLKIDDDLFDVLWNSLGEENSEEIAHARRNHTMIRTTKNTNKTVTSKIILKTIVNALNVNSAEER